MPNSIIEALSSAVHDAWWEEKKKQGFHAPAECPTLKDGDTYQRFTKLCDKCHPDMYPYGQLPNNVQEYDRVMVRTVLYALADMAGDTSLTLVSEDLQKEYMEEFFNELVKSDNSKACYKDAEIKQALYDNNVRILLISDVYDNMNPDFHNLITALAKDKNIKMRYIGRTFDEGSQLCTGFGGCAAILKF